MVMSKVRKAAFVEHIADRLIKGIKEKQSPIVIGIDPVYENIPKAIASKYSQDILGASEAFLEFGLSIIDAVKDVAPAIKPQSAFYELLGYRGIRVLEETVSYAKSKGLMVVDDSKRGDIGSTSKAYADAHIGALVIADKTARVADADFLTVSPYLGTDGIEPFIDTAKMHNKGIFVLVRTSNPQSAQVQTAVVKNKKTVAEELASYLKKAGAADNLSSAVSGYSSIGAVVGATYPEEAKSLRKLLPKAFFLVPGYGAQGATAKDIASFFNTDGLGVLVNASRSVIYAYKNATAYDETIEGFKTATSAAAASMRDDIYRELKNSCKKLCY